MGIEETFWAVDEARLAFDSYDCISHVITELDWTAIFDWETPFFMRFDEMMDDLTFDSKVDSFDAFDAGIQTLGFFLAIAGVFMGQYEPMEFIVDAPRFLDSYWRLFIALYY